MKKTCIALLLINTIIFTGCGGTNTVSPNTPVSNESVETKSEESSEESNESSSDLEALGDIEIEKELFDVTITIPADYVESTTQEELDAEVSDLGCKATLNEDGSATYTMTKSQHKKMMDGITENINNSLNEMIASENYPNITNITANSDFTEFTVTTKNTEPDLAESFAVMGFYMYGGIYHIFNGTTVDNIHIDYVNADSGEIISSADSKDSE